MVRTTRASRSGMPLTWSITCLRLEVVEQAVDREVAAARVLLGRAEHVVAADQQVAALGLGAVSPPSSSSISRGLARNVDVSMIFGPKKMCARRKRRPMMRQFLNRRLMSLGVALVTTSKSFGLRAEQQVAHAAADQVGGVIVAAQALDDFGGVGVDLGSALSAFAVRGTTPTPRNHCVSPARRAPSYARLERRVRILEDGRPAAVSAGLARRRGHRRRPCGRMRRSAAIAGRGVGAAGVGRARGGRGRGRWAPGSARRPGGRRRRRASAQARARRRRRRRCRGGRLAAGRGRRRSARLQRAARCGAGAAAAGAAARARLSQCEPLPRARSAPQRGRRGRRSASDHGRNPRPSPSWRDDHSVSTRSRRRRRGSARQPRRDIGGTSVNCGRAIGRARETAGAAPPAPAARRRAARRAETAATGPAPVDRSARRPDESSIAAASGALTSGRWMLRPNMRSARSAGRDRLLVARLLRPIAVGAGADT